MTKEQLAELLNGRQYREEITDEEAAEASKHGLVVVFGQSDDLVELRGAIRDEVDGYDGVNFTIDKDGVISKPDQDDYDEEEFEEEFVKYVQRKKACRIINAEWDYEGWSWFIKMHIPFAPFEIFEEGEKYCRGIVFDINDL